MNERDSEIISQSLAARHYVESMEMESSDLVILNTCSIRAKAEQKVMSLLGALRKLKARKPSMKICVAGCVAQQEGERILARMPHVDLVAGTQNIYALPELLDAGERLATALSDRYRIPRLLPDAFSASTAGMDAALPFRKFVTIMQGCNNYCAYCVVPYTRGREISRNVNDILDEVIALVDRGVREITLLGQNVNSYGLVRSVTENPLPRPFPALLHRVAAVRGLRRLRFTTSHPKDLSDDLMQCFRDIPILCPQFHLPVQSGSNAVLKRMNRKYTVESYLEKVQSLRSYCPEIVITTDIIVGFPGEREEDFEETLQLLEKVRFAGSFSFKYSDRPGTRAAAFQDKVPESVKSQRLARFQKRQDAISLEHNRGYIGRTLSVMVESSEKGALKSRSTTNHVVHIETEKNIPAGACISAKIVHAGPHSLQGALKK